MKILFVSGNLCDGGAQRVIAVMAGKLAERGHEVAILLFARDEKEYPVNGQVELLSLRGSFEEYRAMSPVSRALSIRRYLKQVKPDVAVGFLEGGRGLFVASLGMRLPRVASARIDPKVLLALKGGSATLNRIWFRSADAVILQTRRQKEHAAATGWRKQTVIANPVSDAALAMEPHDYERPCRRIVMAGRLDGQKNYPLAIRAMEQVLQEFPDAVLDIFGKGREEAALKQLIAQKGLEKQIRLHGWTQDPLGEYARSDVYLLTSDFEGMPNALMEAMAAGLPCISTDCDTGPEDLITDGGNGFLVPVDDADALARRMLQILRMSPAERRRMGQSARRTMQEQFNADVIAGRWEALLTELTKRGRQ